MLGGVLGGGQQQQQQQGGGLLGGGAQQQQGGGGLGGLLGGLTGGGQQQQQQGGGGLGGLLGGLTGGGAQQAGAGGLGGMLGGLLSGGQQGGGGGLGGMLDSLGGGQQQGGGLGGMLNQALGGEQTAQPSADQNAAAEVMLRGMINAAKSDGEIDQQEQEKILEHLGNDVSQEEIDFVRNEFQQPLDVEGFIRSVPQGAEQQVYLMSLLGIDLDSQAEAQYLDQLAKGMGISEQQANQIHAQLGVSRCLNPGHRDLLSRCDNPTTTLHDLRVKAWVSSKACSQAS